MDKTGRLCCDWRRGPQNPWRTGKTRKDTKEDAGTSFNKRWKLRQREREITEEPMTKRSNIGKANNIWKAQQESTGEEKKDNATERPGGEQEKSGAQGRKERKANQSTKLRKNLGSYKSYMMKHQTQDRRKQKGKERETLP